MTTSGVVAWSMTARDIITNALRDEGIISIHEAPSAPEAEICLVRLNAILKAWIGLHLENEATVTIPADAASGTIGEDVDAILNARFVDASGYERVMARFERDEYMSIPNKAANGTPTVFYVGTQRDQLTMYVWPVPSVESTVLINYLRIPETITDLSQTVDFPQKYQEALYSALAVRCAGIFSKVPGQELVARAERLRIDMEDAERPASYFMGAC